MPDNTEYYSFKNNFTPLNLPLAHSNKSQIAIAFFLLTGLLRGGPAK